MTTKKLAESDTQMEGKRTRKQSNAVNEQQRGQQDIDMVNFNQWTTSWAGQPIDGELLNALSSIAPNILRPNPLTLRPNLSYVTPLIQGEVSNDDDGGPGTKVKFVNATVEILQNQIRKEEAPKKKRTRTTPEQLRILQRAFTSDPMPNSSSRLVLAKRLGMNARAVQVWFQNRRAKEKLEAKRAEIGSGSRSPQNSYHSHPRTTPITNQDLYDSARHRHYIHPNHLGLTTDEGNLDYFMNDGGSFTSALYNNYSMEPIVVNNTEIFPEHESPNTSNEDQLGNSPDASHSNYLRFQSLPGNITTINSITAGEASNNSLGLIFEMPPSPGKDFYQRCNSVDVLNVIGDVTTLNDSNKIFCNPTSGEAFLGGPLGNSVPMPKTRSLSVPDIPLMNSISHSDIPVFLRNSDLMAIKEEDIHTEPLSKRQSIAGLPSASLLSSFTGMQELLSLDTDMNSLPTWTADV